MSGNWLLSRRRAMIGAATLPFAPLAGCSWFRPLPPVIGYLETIPSDTPTNLANLDAFRKGLAEQGFVEGETVNIEYRYAGGEPDRLPELAKDLVDLNVAVLVASTVSAARAAKALTSTIPIVFGQAADAIENGEVKDLAHPEGNLTGVAGANALGGKRLRLLAGMVPPGAKIAYVGDPALGAYTRNLRETQEEADRLKRQLVIFKADRDVELDLAFGRMNMSNSGVGGVYIGPIRGAYSRPGRVVKLAARHPRPTIYYDRSFVDAGGLMSYGAAFKEIYHLVGVYTGRILNGAHPGDLPVLQPTGLELVVNAGTARAQGLTLPPEILAEATEVIG